MKLRNKKTGKVEELSVSMGVACVGGKVYINLAKLCEEWEDA